MIRIAKFLSTATLIGLTSVSEPSQAQTTAQSAPPSPIGTWCNQTRGIVMVITSVTNGSVAGTYSSPLFKGAVPIRSGTVSGSALKVQVEDELSYDLTVKAGELSGTGANTKGRPFSITLTKGTGSGSC